MSDVQKVFSNKYRFKVYLRSFLIGMPLLIIGALVFNYFEDSKTANGTPNEKGGNNYWYSNETGTDKLPEELSKMAALYPGAHVTYYNVQTDKEGKATGNITLFTPDAMDKVISFYKLKGTVKNASDTDIMYNNGKQDLRVSKENTYPEDKYQNQTKVNIQF